MHQPILECALIARMTNQQAIKPGVAVIQAWREMDKKQCGMCVSEQIMLATTLLTENPSPTDEQITQYMASNTCECLTADDVHSAVKQAVVRLTAKD